MERSEVAACCYRNLHKSCLPIALTPFPRYQFYSVYTGWPQNVVHFQHTISSEPFKIKWNKFYQNVPSVLGHNKTKAKLRRILNSYVKTTTQPLFPETSGTFRWNLFYFILNGSKDMVCWKVYNFFGPPWTILRNCLWPWGVLQFRYDHTTADMTGTVGPTLCASCGAYID